MRKIAAIGCGQWGKNLVRNFSELGVLRTICEVDPAKMSALRDQFQEINITSSFSDILEDDQVAGVAIATPASSHYSLAKQALLAGKDVFVEKG